jgi:hypothetical protein
MSFHFQYRQKLEYLVDVDLLKQPGAASLEEFDGNKYSNRYGRLGGK